MFGIKVALFIYALFAWSLLIPATKLVINASTQTNCLAQNPTNLTIVLACLDNGPNWEANIITIAVILFLHNAMLTLTYVVNTCHRPGMPLQIFRNQETVSSTPYP